MSIAIAPSPPGSLAAELDALLGQIATLSSVEPTTATVAELAPLLIRLESAQNLLAGINAAWTRAFEDAAGFEDHGAPTLAAWCRRELRVTPAETRRRAKRASTLDALPSVRESFEAGRVGLAHLDVLATGLVQLGADTMAAVEPILLDVNESCDADGLRAAIKQTRDTLDPDAADAAYLAALERRDIRVTPVGDGYDVRGYLDPETGAAFSTVLTSLSAKQSADDDRPSGHRRVDGLRVMSLAFLDHGLPTDRGLRPHLLVTVPADRLRTATAGAEPEGDPGVLDTFGPVHDSVTARLACDCAITPVTVDPATGSVLDVGRTQRLATLKQRQAIHVQQEGRCFNPGCDRTGLEIHHMIAWSLGGRTDLKDLRGYCTRCHHLIHLGLLIVKPDGRGWTHQTRHHHNLPQHKRRTSHLTRVYLRALSHAGKQHALDVTRSYRRSRGHTVIRM